MQLIEELMAAVPVFEGLNEAQLEVVAGCGRNTHVEAGELLLREGDAADWFYVIRHGTVSLEVHAPARGTIRIETLNEGDAVGWSWLFSPYRWQLDARTLESCSLIAFDGACLRGKCESDHELGYELMKRFAANLVDRLQATRLQLLDVYGHAGS